MSEYKRIEHRDKSNVDKILFKLQKWKKSPKDFAWLFKLKQNISGGEKFLACQFSLQYYITVP